MRHDDNPDLGANPAAAEADDDFFDVAEVSSAAAPAKGTVLEQCVDSIKRKGGLTATQLCFVTHNMVVDLPGATKNSIESRYDGSEVMQMPSYAVYKKEPNSVLNVGIIFNGTDRLIEESINSENFGKFCRLSLGTVKADCIQMPMAITGMGRAHYVQVQIFKQGINTIGARIVDSTGNPIAMGAAKDQVLALLESQRAHIAPVLGITPVSGIPVAVGTVSVVHTGIQPSIGDKRCGVFVFGGIFATTKAVLEGGPEFLRDDVKVKALIEREHQLVKHTPYLQAHCNQNVLVENGSIKTAYTSLAKAVDAMAEKRPVAAASDYGTTASDATDNALVTAVSAALEKYSKQHAGSFGRLFHSRGTAYMENAKHELNNVEKDPVKKLEIAKRIVRDILSESLMQTKSERAAGSLHGDAFQVKSSRAEILLTELKRAGLITDCDISKNAIIKFETLSGATAEGQEMHASARSLARE